MGPGVGPGSEVQLNSTDMQLNSNNVYPISNYAMQLATEGLRKSRYDMLQEGQDTIAPLEQLGPYIALREAPARLCATDTVGVQIHIRS